MNLSTMTGESTRYQKPMAFQDWFLDDGMSIEAPNWMPAGSTYRGEEWDKFKGFAWAGMTLIIRDFM